MGHDTWAGVVVGVPLKEVGKFHSVERSRVVYNQNTGKPESDKHRWKDHFVNFLNVEYELKSDFDIPDSLKKAVAEIGLKTFNEGEAVIVGQEVCHDYQRAYNSYNIPIDPIKLMDALVQVRELLLSAEIQTAPGAYLVLRQSV